MLFKKKISQKSYHPIEQRPVIEASICNGEQVAGFIDNKTGRFEDVMLISTSKDLEEFKKIYGIKGEIEKIY